MGIGAGEPEIGQWFKIKGAGFGQIQSGLRRAIYEIRNCTIKWCRRSAFGFQKTGIGGGVIGNGCTAGIINAGGLADLKRCVAQKPNVKARQVCALHPAEGSFWY